MRKKRILYQSDAALAKTGFGRCAKAVLTYLYKTGKYEIYHYCGGHKWSDISLQRTPWKSFGALPDDDAELQNLNRDPQVGRAANYGNHYLNRVVEVAKPDIYIAAQDIWGIDFALSRNWFNKINTVFWTTLDSRPILPSAVDAASKMKNFWIWSDFATKELHDMGHTHVKTMHGPVDQDFFKPLPLEVKQEMREKMGIAKDLFVIGFVFRNQLRKSVPNLLEGYAMWKKKYHHKKSALLLHTHFGEGWNITKLAKEYNIPMDEILTTYTCRACKNYEVSNFTAIEKDCKSCGGKKSCTTTNISSGVSEWQLNDVYNLMDVYCHPFTSGGQEYPIQEAKLAGLITLVTNYSCGEEMCSTGAHSLPLDWSEYREHGTEFIKASTSPKSIMKQLQKVFVMKQEQRIEMGLKGREWTLKNYSINSVGKKFEEFLDSCELVDWDNISIEDLPKNPFYEMPEIKEQKEWLLHMYHNILKMEQIDDKDEGYKYWEEKLIRGLSREEVEKEFRKVAMQDHQKRSGVKFEDILGKDDKGKRILYVMPASATDLFLSTSLFKSIKEQYPDYNLYVATSPHLSGMLAANDYVYKTIPYASQMDDLLWCEGFNDHEGYFEVAFLPHFSTRKNLDYLHNGKDKIALELKY